MGFHDEREAIEIANGTTYGLSAIVWTQSLPRAHRISHQLQAGSITVNATATPRGGPGVGVVSVEGHKESGFGVEGGLEGLAAYLSTSAVQLNV
jgi:aldehyde dehydrogenase (NAD+)